ncbi:MAG: Deoxyribose-phosphate aldolase (modular protein) [Bacteroidetes bacterium]|nr:Deoxyribose-phosphate aldolase (modular protein) [Bacteroidota bacterium]
MSSHAPTSIVSTLEPLLSPDHPPCSGDPCADPICPTHRRDEIGRVLAAARTHVAHERPRIAGAKLAGLIDHTLLKPDATISDVERVCAEAAQYRFASVCVNPVFLPLVRSLTAGSDVPLCTVVGFPLGAVATETKAAETELAIREGAAEIDMVMNIGLFRSGQYRFVSDDIRAVTSVVQKHRKLCKVILETALLTDAEKIRACLLARAAGADFVKTSTGFASRGATVEDVTLMRLVVGPGTGVKAAGGIRTYEDAISMIAAGANRIGTSAGVSIVTRDGTV